MGLRGEFPPPANGGGELSARLTDEKGKSRYDLTTSILDEGRVTRQRFGCIVGKLGSPTNDYVWEIRTLVNAGALSKVISGNL